MDAPEFVEEPRRAKIDRYTVECAGTVTSKACRSFVLPERSFVNEKTTPVSAVAENRKDRSALVAFVADTTKARVSVGDSGFTFCGEETTRPFEIRAM